MFSRPLFSKSGGPTHIPITLLLHHHFNCRTLLSCPWSVKLRDIVMSTHLFCLNHSGWISCWSAPAYTQSSKNSRGRRRRPMPWPGQSIQVTMMLPPAKTILDGDCCFFDASFLILSIALLSFPGGQVTTKTEGRDARCINGRCDWWCASAFCWQFVRGSDWLFLCGGDRQFVGGGDQWSTSAFCWQFVRGSNQHFVCVRISPSDNVPLIPHSNDDPLPPSDWNF